jgi:hypothetical protein
MALIDCQECGKQISDKASACPNCGAPVSAASSQAAPVIPKKQGSSPTTKVLGVIVLAMLLFVLWGMWRSVTNDKAAPPTAGLFGAIRQPVKVVNERTQLNEGQSMIYGFTLNTDSRVQVQVNAQPKDVDVMLMTAVQAQRFRDVSGQLFGGNYTYTQALSGQRILNMDKTVALPKGDWAIVVMRPREAILLQDSTAAQTLVTVY